MSFEELSNREQLEFREKKYKLETVIQNLKDLGYTEILQLAEEKMKDFDEA